MSCVGEGDGAGRCLRRIAVHPLSVENKRADFRPVQRLSPQRKILGFWSPPGAAGPPASAGTFTVHRIVRRDATLPHARRGWDRFGRGTEGVTAGRGSDGVRQEGGDPWHRGCCRRADGHPPFSRGTFRAAEAVRGHIIHAIAIRGTSARAGRWDGETLARRSDPRRNAGRHEARRGIVPGRAWRMGWICAADAFQSAAARLRPAEKVTRVTRGCSTAPKRRMPSSISSSETREKLSRMASPPFTPPAGQNARPGM